MYVRVYIYIYIYVSESGGLAFGVRVLNPRSWDQLRISGVGVRG